MARDWQSTVQFFWFFLVERTVFHVHDMLVNVFDEFDD